MEDHSDFVNLSKVQKAIFNKNKQELLANVAATSEIPQNLNISTEALPHKTQQLLMTIANYQAAMNIDGLDLISIHQQRTKAISQRMEDEYKLLELRHKNKQLQLQIDRDQKVIDELEKELEDSKVSLASQNPSPDSVAEIIRQTKQKLASYEEIYEKAKAKFAKLCVPDGIHPRLLDQLVTCLVALREEEAILKQRADELTLARQARGILLKLRK